MGSSQPPPVSTAGTSGALNHLHINLSVEPELDNSSEISVFNKYPAKQHAQIVARHLDRVYHGLIYLKGQRSALFPDSDQPVKFRQLRDFYYMSGVDEPDCYLAYDIEQDFLTLFIPKFTAKEVIWFGGGSTIDEAYDKYDVDYVDYSDGVTDYLGRWLYENDGKIYTLGRESDEERRIFRGRFDHKKLHPAMHLSRVIKCPHEIELIRKANDISSQAHREVMARITSFGNEAEVHAWFINACMTRQGRTQAYQVIAASGKNASTLHYVKNNESFSGRQLMLLDAACEWQCYASDITRTYPLSTRWPSREAKEIYDLVSSMQEHCFHTLRPGTRFRDVHFHAHQVAARGLLRLGILHHGTEDEILRAGTTLAFFPHGLGHHVGLDVHDVLDLSLFSDGCLGHLREGMIITIEPGIYFSEFALKNVWLRDPKHARYINTRALRRYMSVGGVRIEDDILITSTGYQNLSSAPKGEEMMRIIRSGDRGYVPLEASPAVDNSLQPPLRQYDLSWMSASFPAMDIPPPTKWPESDIEQRPVQVMETPCDTMETSDGEIEPGESPTSHPEPTQRYVSLRCQSKMLPEVSQAAPIKISKDSDLYRRLSMAGIRMASSCGKHSRETLLSQDSKVLSEILRRACEMELKPRLAIDHPGAEDMRDQIKTRYQRIEAALETSFRYCKDVVEVIEEPIDFHDPDVNDPGRQGISWCLQELRRQGDLDPPAVPGKLPLLPEKPLAYRNVKSTAVSR